MGAIGHVRLSNAEVEALYADSELAGTDEAGAADPQGSHVEVWFAYLNTPSTGRALLGDRGFERLLARLDLGQHAYWIATAGREALVDDDFVRGTNPQKITLRQGATPFELRDLDMDLPTPPGLPGFNSQLVVALPPLAGLDPGAPASLEYTLTRKKGFIMPELVHRAATIDYRPPAGWFDRPPAPLPEWLQAWQARATELAVITAALLAPLREARASRRKRRASRKLSRVLSLRVLSKVVK